MNTIDWGDFKNLTLDSLRSSVALVSQDITLFDDTVVANICYGLSDAVLDDVVAAAKNSAAHDFIEALPHGYNTLVGENGVRLVAAKPDIK